jgi:hypothetical protein
MVTNIFCKAAWVALNADSLSKVAESIILWITPSLFVAARLLKKV